MLRVTFLGTGTSQGVPLIACRCHVCTSSDERDKRLRTSIHVQSDTTSIVVDTGPDFRQQMLANNITQLDAILLTHSHKDHIAGLDDVRAYNYIYKRPMPVYGSEYTVKELQREFPYIFDGTNYPGIPQVDIMTLEAYQEFMVGDIHIKVVPVMHYKMPVWCYVFNKKFAYITDANAMPNQSKDCIRDADVLVINALRQESHISHYSLPEALALASELNVGEAYFVHASHQLGTYLEITNKLPAHRHLAYDGLVVDLPF
jgi:phosphoribosyl 1,2-cyclic phosphate phosphodiesterase